GDAHEMEVIGWGSLFHDPDTEATTISAARRATLALLVERGARHHIFSATSAGDLDLIRGVVEENPRALERRVSRFEDGQTPLHFAMNRRRYDILALLIELGADLEATDASGHTALELAMLRGDRQAMTLLHAAGAKQPASAAPEDFTASMARLRES